MVNVDKTVEGLLLKFKGGESYESRKIVLWYDIDLTASEQDIEEIKSRMSKNNIKTLILKNNFFEIKKIIEYDEPSFNFLIYSKEKENKYEENWLLDIELFSAKFENSRIADIKATLNIDGSKFDLLIDKHYDFFKSKIRIDAFKLIYQDTWNEDEFVKGLFAVITKTKVIDLNSIIRNLLISSFNEKENVYWAEILKYGLKDKFWEIVKNNYGYISDYPTLEKFFGSFIVTHINYHTSIVLKGYDQHINKKANDCEVFLNSWIRNSIDQKKYQEYASNFEEKNLELLKSQFADQTELIDNEVEALEFFDKILILNITNQLTSNGQNYSLYKEIIESRKNKIWYKSFESTYEALYNAISLYEFISSETVEPNSLIRLYELYKNKYYKADYYYRKFYEYFNQCNNDILKKKLSLEVEKIYNNRFLDRFLEVWTNAIELETNQKWKIGHNPSQEEFYELYVKKYSNKDNKIVVIISDALRYEVAVELKEKLNALRGITELNDLVSCIPSCTKIGMACLLPHNKISYDEGAILCDNINTKDTPNREKILQKKEKDSIARSYKEFDKISRQEKRDLFKGKNVIYIYHNKIDDVGDNLNSENEVFSACNTTIKEIYDLINELSNSINISNIIVTSDHGFIYKRESLKSYDKIDLGSFNNEFIDLSKRYAVTNENIEVNNVHKFKLDFSEENLFVYVPKGDLRFKTQGGGINYVHGGVSPQEVTIPVLIYKHTRSDKDLDKKNVKYGYVNITLLNPSRKITNNIFSINLYQTERVTDKLKPITCKISLFDPDAKEKVSDEKTVIIDSDSEDPQKRKYAISLTLRSNIQNKKHLLRIYEVNQERMIDEIPFEVDLGMTNDFDDF